MNELQKEYFQRVEKEQAEVQAAEEARLKAVMDAERKKDAAKKEAEKRAAEEADKKAEAEAIEIINRVKAEMAANKKKEAEAAKKADAGKQAVTKTAQKTEKNAKADAEKEAEAIEEEVNIYEREPVGEASMPKKSPKFKKGGKKGSTAKVPQRPQQEAAVTTEAVQTETSVSATESEKRKEAQPEKVKKEVPDVKQETKKSEAKEDKAAKKEEPKTNEDEVKEAQKEEKATPESVAASQREAKLQELADEYQDKYKRLLAEFENARAREAKEATRMYDVGAKAVLEKLLPVVDNFERAIQAIPEEDKDRAFEQGVDKIYKQMMTILGDIGVEPMNAEGTEFNPDLHNAVMHVEDEELGENIVAEEMQKGYMYKDSVLRYSMVKVAN